MKFSVLLCLYIKADVSHLRQALDSLCNQHLLPAELIVVFDGPVLYDHRSVVSDIERCQKFRVKVVQLPKNVGLGPALKAGLSHCSYELVARMDADDICYPTRFSRQISHLEQHPSIDVLGSSIMEFITDESDATHLKTVPTTNSEIYHYGKMRCPFNHPTVVYKKTTIESVGSYESVPYFEDYFLWLKLMKAGATFENISEPLLYFRTGNDLIGRRHGLTYLKHEIRFLLKAYRRNLLSGPIFLTLIFTRTPMRIAPKSILTFFYKTFLREHTQGDSA